MRLPSEKNARAFRGKRPAAQFARYLLNMKEIESCYEAALETLQSDNFEEFQRAIKRFEVLENYVLNG